MTTEHRLKGLPDLSSEQGIFDSSELQQVDSQQAQQQFKQGSHQPSTSIAYASILPCTETNLIGESIEGDVYKLQPRGALDVLANTAVGRKPRLPQTTGFGGVVASSQLGIGTNLAPDARIDFKNQKNVRKFRESKILNFANVHTTLGFSEQPKITSDEPIISEEVLESEMKESKQEDMLRKVSRQIWIQSEQEGLENSDGDGSQQPTEKQQKMNKNINNTSRKAREFKQAKSIVQTNGQRLWSIVRRDIYFPIKFQGKVENGLWKKRISKFKGTQVQSESVNNVFFFIQPNSTFNQLWEMFTGIAQLYFAILMPMRICFHIENDDYYTFDLALEGIFLLDMFISCITGINVGGEIIRDRSVLFQMYLSSNFIWDLLLLVPYQFIEVSLGYIKIFRLARHWNRILLFLHKTIYFIFKGGSSHKFAVLLYYLFKVSILILLCVHFLTCLWIQAGQEEDAGQEDDIPEKFHQDGWVTKFYRAHFDVAPRGEMSKDVYISGYYFVTTTIATVGYGDFSSHTVMECIFTMCCEFFGIALFGYISGGLVSAVKVSLLVGMLKRSEDKDEFDNWLFQRERNKLEPLQLVVQRYLRVINGFNSTYNFSEFFHESAYFHYMPKEQKRKIFNLLFTDIATFFGAFFRNISELSMIQEIFGFMHPLTFLPGGEIIQHQSLSRGVYFIVSGKVYLCCEDRVKSEEIFQEDVFDFKKSKHWKKVNKLNFRKLKAGSFFGEFCLLEKNSEFRFLAGGKDPILVLFITKSKLNEIGAKYKETFAWLKKFAYYRFKYFAMEKVNYNKRKNAYTREGTTYCFGEGQKKEPQKEVEYTIWENPEFEESEAKSSDETKKIELVRIANQMEAMGVDSNAASANHGNDGVLVTENLVFDTQYEQDFSGIDHVSIIPINSGRNAIEDILDVSLLQQHQNQQTQQFFLSSVTPTGVGRLHAKTRSETPGLLDRHGGGVSSKTTQSISSPKHVSDIDVIFEKAPDSFFAQSSKTQQQAHSRIKSCTLLMNANNKKRIVSSDNIDSKQIIIAEEKIAQFGAKKNFLNGGVKEREQEDAKISASTDQVEENLFLNDDQLTPELVLPRKVMKQPGDRMKKKWESSDFQNINMEEYLRKSEGILPVFRFNVDNNHPLFFNSFTSNSVESNNYLSSPFDTQLLSPHSPQHFLLSPTANNRSTQQLWNGEKTDEILENDEEGDAVMEGEENTESMFDNPPPVSQTRQLSYPNQMLPQESFNPSASTQLLKFDSVISATSSSSLPRRAISINTEEDGVKDDQRGSEVESSGEKQVDQRNSSIENWNAGYNSGMTFSKIKKAEKKVRNAFRMMSASNAQDEVEREKNQLKIVKEVGIENIHSNDLSRISSLQYRKHKVMKKMLQKKIDMMVSQTSNRSGGSPLHNASFNSTVAAADFSSGIMNNKSSFAKKLNATHNNSSKFKGKSNPGFPSISKSHVISSTASLKDEKAELGLALIQSQVSENKLSLYSDLANGGEQITPNHRQDIFVKEQKQTIQKRRAAAAAAAYNSLEESEEINWAEFRGTVKDLGNDDEDTAQQAVAGGENKRVLNRKKKGVAFAEPLKESENDNESNMSSSKGRNSSELENGNRSSNNDENDISEASEDEENSIEMQMDRINQSRFPNFELMLFIEKIISKHEEEYEKEVAVYHGADDDYQCYEELEIGEQKKDFDDQNYDYYVAVNSVLDNSIDIPIDTLAPNFDADEIFIFPSFLEDQVNALDVKVNQIVTFVYDECLRCVEKIQKLQVGKSKIKQDSSQQPMPSIKDVFKSGSGSVGADFEGVPSTIGIPGSQRKSFGVFDKVASVGQNNPFLLATAKSIVQYGGDLEKGLFPKKLETVDGKVHLGLNIQFTICAESENGDEDSEKGEYNFFTELDRKNQLHRDKYNLKNSNSNHVAASSLGRSQGTPGLHFSVMERELFKGTTLGVSTVLPADAGAPAAGVVSGVVLRTQNLIDTVEFQQTQTQKNITEKQKIKQEFKKLFNAMLEPSNGNMTSALDSPKKSQDRTS